MSLCNTNIKPVGFSEEVVLERLRRDYGLYSINNVQSNLDICTEIFNAPTYTSNLTKIMSGLTESSFGVFNVTENQITFVYEFTGNTEFLSAYTGTFQYDIHKRNE